MGLSSSSSLLSPLDTGKDKLQGTIKFENLPSERNDNLWDRIEKECHLDLDELSALKNAACSPQGNGKKV